MISPRMEYDRKFLEEKFPDLEEDYCTCGCHYPTDGFRMMHFMACCHPCKKCTFRVKSFNDEHIDRCPGQIIIDAYSQWKDTYPEVYETKE